MKRNYFHASFTPKSLNFRTLNFLFGYIMIEISVLGSGSRGNSTWISNGTDSFLIDAGFCGRELDERLTKIGHNLKDVQAVVITHDHGDHINGAGVVARNANAPVWIHARNLNKLKKRLGKRVEFQYFTPLMPFTIGAITITPFETPHDATHSSGFIIEQDGAKIGYATDVGFPEPSVIAALKKCDILVIESNHDEELLRTGPYPPILQARISSDEGHLSNRQTAEILKAVAHEHLKQVILIHLSGENNNPSLALAEAKMALEGFSTEIVLSTQVEPTARITL